MACAAANDPEGPKAAALAKEFEALLLRRYGKITRLEKERRDLASGRARMVNIEDLPMAHLPDSDLRELEGLLANATPGPWFIEKGRGPGRVPSSDNIRSEKRCAGAANWIRELWVYQHGGDEAKWPANAALIVAMHSALPSLIADLREAREEVEALKADNDIEPGEEEIERLAKLIAAELGDNYDLAFEDRLSQRLCRAPDGSFRDVNEPQRNDYHDAARAVLAAISTGDAD